MQNPFLVVRSIFFALLLCLNVLLFVFAAWNLVAVRHTAPGAPMFLAVNAALIILFVTLASIAEAICPRARPGHVRVECGWTILMTTLQLASSINVTVSGPPMICHLNWTWSTCASSSLLVSVTWLVTFTILVYCLTICFTASAHAPSIPNIWTMPVSSVPWFSDDSKVPASSSEVLPEKDPKTFSRFSSASGESCAVTRYIAERWGKLSGAERQSHSPSNPMLFPRGHQSADTTRPNWARQIEARRGVDVPFAKPPSMPAVRKVQAIQPTPLPTVLAKAVAMPRDSHYVEVCRESEMKLSDGRSSLTLQTPGLFPKGTADPDLPIPLPHLSQWIRADAAK
ncbi:hypothetical protein SCLCIDRAFT_80752, partial [Scleroderma citrinum Foug A]